jgi:hypothetical protein
MTAGIATVLPPEAAVPIPAGTGSLDREDEPIARFLSLTTNPPTAATLCDAVLAAAALNDDARFRVAAIGREIAERRFSLAAFQSRMGQLGTLAVGTP